MRTGRGAIVTLAMQMAKYLTGLAALVVLARLLQPADYGLVAMASAIAGLATVLGDFGLSLAALQAPRLDQDQKSNLFWFNGGVGLVSAGLVAASAVPLAAFYDEPRLVAVTLLLSTVFAVNGFAVQLKVEVNRAQRFTALGLIDLIGAGVGLVVAVVAAALGAGYWALISQQIVGAVAALVVAAALARWVPSRPNRRGRVGSLLRFGRDTAALHVANYVTGNLDTVLLGRVAGAAPLGLYNRAFQLVLLPLDQLLSPLTRVLLPRLSGVDDREEFSAVLARLQRVLAYVAVAPFGLLAATAGPLLTGVLGPQWAGAAPLLQILVIGAVFQALGYVYYWAFLAKGRTGLLFVSELWGRVPMVVLMILLVRFGPAAVAFSVVVGQVLIWLAATARYAGRIGVRPSRLLPLSIRPLVIYGAATAACLVVSPALDALPALVQLLVLVVLWGAVASLGLLVPACRRDVIAVIAEIRPSRRTVAVPVSTREERA